MIRFSVITITYNAEQCLRRTLESVLAQSYSNVEHIIVDGASTDSTLAIANEYKNQSEAQKTLHDVIIQSEPDKGLYDAMNKGLHLATGDYIVYMNAGDSFASGETLSKIVTQLQEDNLPAVVFGNTDITDNDGNIIGRRRLSPPEHLSWKSFKQGMLVCHQAFYARLDIAKHFPYNLQYKHSADIDWCIRIMKQAKKQHLLLHNTHLVLANYQKEGQTTKFHKASLMERFHIMSKHYGLFSTLLMHIWFVIRIIFKH